MPSSEPYRKRRRSGKTNSQSLRSHKEYKDDAPDSTQPQLVERPATVEELREARLNYIETPISERQKRMKHEHVKTVPSKIRVSTSDRKSTRTSAASKRTAKIETRSRRRSRTEDSHVSEAAHEDDYVYRRGQPAVRSSGHDEHARETADEESTRRVERESTTERPRRPTRTRRHTVDATSFGGERVESTISSTARPQLRKSTTAVPKTTLPALGRNDIVERAKTVVSTARSTTADTRKSSGVLGGLFMSKPAVPEKKVSCLTCGDDVSSSRTARLPCSHRMCHSCLKRVFKLSVTDPAHMPPRCCTEQHIDLKHVDSLFDHDFKKTWNRKFKEYKAKNRIYCPKRGCGEWIQPKHISIDKGRKIGKCASCKTYVCGICSQKLHKSRDCPKDPATKEFVEIAKKQGWQKCYSCSAMVELKEGCNHMTCRCTAEFCMVCAKKWKSCDCPWFSYSQVDILGNPVRFQEEMDRRRDQERRDEELARRMEVLDVVDPTDRHGGINMFDPRNAANRHNMNATFIQQAREALTANYQHADQAARGILNGFFVMGRDINNNNSNNVPLDPAEAITMTPAGVPVVRHRYRRRGTLQDLTDDRVETVEEMEQSRRIRNWANGVPD